MTRIIQTPSQRSGQGPARRAGGGEYRDALSRLRQMFNDAEKLPSRTDAAWLEAAIKGELQ